MNYLYYCTQYLNPTLLINVIMKLKILIFIFLAGNFPLLLHAQESPNGETNMFRANDTIVKQQVEYKNPGRAGENVFWNFGKLKTLDNKYTIVYSKPDSANLITGTEHQTRYFYELRNDSLLLRGYENPTTKVTYYMPEVILKFPLAYGNKTDAYYAGKGIYCDKLDVWAYGKSTSEVDAYGFLILPTGDTLRHVSRVHTVQLIAEKILPVREDRIVQTVQQETDSIKISFTDSIQTHLNADSVVLMVDTYKWYVSGYRYPIFETVSTGSYRDNGKTTYFGTAFFYPPQVHGYLAKDEKNQQVQNEILAADMLATRSAQGNTLVQNTNTQNENASIATNTIEFTYNIYPNPVENQLTFEFLIDKDATVSYGLYNIMGSLIYQQRSRKLQAGAYDDQIDMSRLMRGEYILRMKVNEKVYGEKIIKK